MNLYYNGEALGNITKNNKFKTSNLTWDKESESELLDGSYPITDIQYFFAYRLYKDTKY